MPPFKEKKKVVPKSPKKPAPTVTHQQIGNNNRGVLLKIFSNEMPAGEKKPVPVKSGPKIISISNPNNGLGNVTFSILGITHSLPYSPGAVDLGTVFDFPAPDAVYEFTNNAIGPNPVSVFLNIEDFV